MSLHQVYPGEYFIFKRDRPGASWDLLFRDDSRSTMDYRFSYQVENLKPGQAVRYEMPNGALIEEVEK